MQNVLVPFPFLAPLAEGSVDSDPGTRDPETFSLLFGDGKAADTGAAEPQPVSPGSPVIAAGLVPPEFWPLTYGPSDLAPTPEIDLKPAVERELPDKIPQPDDDHGSTERKAETMAAGARSTSAHNAALPATGLSWAHHFLISDPVADQHPEKVPEAFTDPAAPKLPGILADGRSGDREVRLADAAQPEPLDGPPQAVNRARIEPPVDAQTIAVNPAVVAEGAIKTSGVDQRPLPQAFGPMPARSPMPPPTLAPGSTSAPALVFATASARWTYGSEGDAPGHRTSGIDTGQPWLTTLADDPDQTLSPVPPTTVPRPQTDEPNLKGAPPLAGEANSTTASAKTPETQNTAIADLFASVPAPASYGGRPEGIITVRSKLSGHSALMIDPTIVRITGLPGTAPDPLAFSDDPFVQHDRSPKPSGDAGHMSAPVHAPDPKALSTLAVSLPSSPLPAPSIAAHRLIEGFDLSQFPGEDIALIASGVPAVLLPHAQGNPYAGTAAQIPQLVAQIAGALHQSAEGTTEFALSPEELGHVRLRLEPDAANPDRMVIMISFERPETLDLFRRYAGDLAEAVRAAGYSGADIGFAQHGGGRDADRQQGSHGTSFADGSDPPPPLPNLLALRLAGGTSLDLRL
jgi:hypothetical protein